MNDRVSAVGGLPNGSPRPGRPAAAPCHICKKPQPPCQHEGCYRHYSDGHQNVRTVTEDRDGARHSETRCQDCGAFFGASIQPLEWFTEVKA